MNEQSRLFNPPRAFPEPPNVLGGGYMPTYPYTPAQQPQAQLHTHIGDPRHGPSPLPPRQFPVQPAFPSEYTSAVPRDFDPIPFQPVTGYVNNDSRRPTFPQVHSQAPSLAHAPSHAHAPSPAHAPSHAHTPSHARAPSHAHAPSHTHTSSRAHAPSHAHSPNHAHAHAPSHIRAPSHARAPDSAQPPPYNDNGFGGFTNPGRSGGPEPPYLFPPVQSSGGRSYGEASSRATYDFGPPSVFGGPALPVPRPLVGPSSTQAQPQFDAGHHQDRRPHAPVSRPPRVGQKKALLAGVDYSKHRDHRFRLQWGVRDAKEMARFLQEHLGFHPNNIRILTDDQRKNLPTKENILSGMRWLVEGAQPGDSLFFYFSGHATQIKDEDGDEPDGFDECLCAMDYDGRKNPPTGLIVDDQMHGIMVRPLPRGCRLTAVLDCCNSGTLLDLPYIYDSRGVLKQNRPDIIWRKASDADVISLSACKDGGKAYEVRGGGALREAFITYMMRSGNRGTHLEVIQSLRAHMAQNGLVQLPQLSSSHWIDTNERFIVTG